MKPSLRHRLWIVGIGVLAGAGFGIAYAVTFGRGALTQGALAGALIAIGIGVLEGLATGRRARRLLGRLPFAAFVAVRTAIWIAWIAAVLLFVPFALHDASAKSADFFARAIAYSLVVSLLVAALLEVSRLLGFATLWNLLIGRYHRPRIEERAFLMLDLVGSTAVAERIHWGQEPERFLPDRWHKYHFHRQ